MAASTLALGQASYTLLEAIGTEGKINTSGSTVTLQAKSRGGLVSNVGIEGETNKTLNVTDRSAYLNFNDIDAAGITPSAANINLLASTENSIFGLGAGDNRLNAAADFIRSEVQALSGSDTVRIGGKADGSFVALGSGNDNLTVSRTTANLDVSMGSGDDTSLFLGTLNAGGGSVANWQSGEEIGKGANIIDTGDGADLATFLGGVKGGTPGSTGYELQLGAGNDTAVFGGNSDSEGFLLDTGSGSDKVTLGRNTRTVAIDLGWDEGGETTAGDTVVLGVGATLANSAIRSGQSQDILNFAGTVTDTSLDLGWGNAEVKVDGKAGFGTSDTTVWDLGAGDDVLTFGARSDISLLGEGSGFISLGSGADQLNLLGSGYGGDGAIEFDLGNDRDADTIIFGIDSSYAGFTISNFGTNDILFIGAGSYGYGYQFLNEFANEWDLQAFQGVGNVIWSQDNDAAGVNQSLMTMDQDFFEVNTDGAWTALNDSGEPVIDQYGGPIAITQPDQFASPDNWGYGTAESPMSMSEAPPTPPTFPGDNNT